VQSPCDPLIGDYTEMFYIIDEEDIPSIQWKMSLSGSKPMRKVEGLGLIFNNFYVLALTPRLNSTETSLQLSENISLLCGLPHIYRRHQERDLDRHQVFGAYHFYI
jgi:hypothetical protein